MEANTRPFSKKRIGFHYFPDTLHYRESDLLTWLPELKSLGAGWLTLVAPPDRAIPETFVAGLLEAGIEPILHFALPLVTGQLADGHQLLFHTYASWGVRYAVLFDRPNTRAVWPTNAWVQADLVERFLDLYIPLAESALQAGLTPVFPPLEPGGDYWDTAFLRVALQSLLRRGQTRLLHSLVLSAYAHTENVPLDWGAGGPECWPGARPYFTPDGQQDQRGFYIFDWYFALTRAVLGVPLPMLLFGAGKRIKDGSDPARAEQDETIHALENLALVRLISGERVRFPIPAPWEILSPALSSAPNKDSPSVLPPVPSEVLACNFWLLSSNADSPCARDAWFLPDGRSLPVVGAVRQWNHKQQAPSALRSEGRKAGFELKNILFPGEDASPARIDQQINDHPIAHYLLLPAFEGGVTEWYLDAIRPYIKKYRPTVGFSIEEAAFARHVTVVGGEHTYPQEALEKLLKAGCRVERIGGDGTSIATQLATR
jgi:hypothetical protein